MSLTARLPRRAANFIPILTVGERAYTSGGMHAAPSLSRSSTCTSVWSDGANQVRSINISRIYKDFTSQDLQEGEFGADEVDRSSA
jgi:hypothetical protein